MAKLIILRGVSGSGKSTWAKMYSENTGAIVVSRDSIRVMLYGTDGPSYYLDDKAEMNVREGKVTVIQNAMISRSLENGYDVVVDNTNTEWKFVKEIAKIGSRYGAETEIKVFDVPLAHAIGADRNRGATGGRYVGETIIRKQHQRLQGTINNTLEPVAKVAPYTGTPGKPKAFLVDIDGTLAHMRDYRGPFDWAKVGLDDVDEVIAGIVNALKETNWDDYTVIIMSGRDESCRPETIDWLNKHAIWSDLLYMRPARDMRPDNIVKAELFDRYIRDNFDVQFVLDDRQQVVDMWRSMGLTCLQVAEGNF